MARSICRLGDRCSGHGCWAPRPNDESSQDVFCNDIGVHRETDHWITHCCGSECHDSVLARGSRSVFVNDLPVARIGDPVACGSAVIEGSLDSFCGG